MRFVIFANAMIFCVVSTSLTQAQPPQPQTVEIKQPLVQNPAGGTGQPETLAALIATKNRLLDEFKALRQSGPPEAARETLGKIMDVHRRTLNLAINQQEGAEAIGTFRQVFLNDGEFYSNELFSAGQYVKSAKLRRELQQLYAKSKGDQAAKTQEIRWKAVEAERVAAASQEQLAAYVSAKEQRPKGLQALNDKRLQDAEKIYLAIVEAETSVLKEHPIVGSSLNRLGLIQQDQKKFAEAEKTQRRALAIAEATQGRGVLFAVLNFNLGRTYQMSNRYADAEAKYLETAKIEEEVLGARHKSHIQTLGQLTTLYDASGEKDKALSIRKRIAAADPINNVLGHVPQLAFAAAAAEPNAMLQNPKLQTLPFEMIEAMGLEGIDLNPMEVEAVAGFAVLGEKSDDNPLQHWGVVFRLRDGVKRNFGWLERMQKEQRGGVRFHKQPIDSPSALCSVEFDDGCVLVCTDTALDQVLSSTGESRVAQMLRADRASGQAVAAIDVKRIRPLLKYASSQASKTPPALEKLRKLPDDIDNLRASIDVSSGLNIALNLFAVSEPAAKESAAAISEAMDFGFEMLQTQAVSGINGDRPFDLATKKYVRRLVTLTRGKVEPNVQGNRLLVAVDLFDQAYTPAMVALMLPAVQAARQAATKTQASNKLRNIGLAFHNHHDAFGSFCAADGTRNGKGAGLSWRVHLLPFLERQDLYDRFHLNEPWDSEHNKTLIGEMPDVFKVGETDPGKTSIHVMLGDDVLFGNGSTTPAMKDITDGMSNTILFVQAGTNVADVWTKPGGLKVTRKSSVLALGNSADRFNVVMADGAYMSLQRSLGPTAFFQLLTHQGDEIVDLP